MVKRRLSPTPLPSRMAATSLVTLTSSGVFLVGAYDYLVEAIERKLSRGQYADESYYVNIEGKKVLSVKGRKAIINNCI